MKNDGVYSQRKHASRQRIAEDMTKMAYLISRAITGVREPPPSTHKLKPKDSCLVEIVEILGKSRQNARQRHKYTAPTKQCPRTIDHIRRSNAPVLSVDSQ